MAAIPTDTDVIAKAGDKVPGLGNAFFASLYDPLIRGGHLGFPALLGGVPASKRSALFNGIAGNIRLVAQTGTPAPDVTGAPLEGGPTFSSFNGYEISGAITVFQAKIAGSGVTSANNNGIWIQDSAGMTHLVLRTGQTIDGHIVQKIVTFMPGNGSPGQERGWLHDNEGPEALALVMFTDGGEAIVSASLSGNISIISETGAAGPGLPSSFDSSFVSYGVPTTNDQGDTAFLATIQMSNQQLAAPGTGPVTRSVGAMRQADAPAPTTAQGIFINRPFKLPQPNLQLSPQFSLDTFFPLVEVGQETSIGTSTFRTLKDPVLAADGGLAFASTIGGGGIKGVAANTLWWLPPDGEFQLLAQGGQRAGIDLPANVVWSSFQSLAIAANRGPIFKGTLVRGKGGVTAANDTGVWAVDFNGDVRLLFRTGDKGAIIPGKTLQSFDILRAAGYTSGVTRSFNDQQQVVWRAQFTDGSVAFITSEVP